jgi:phosphonopyruvate decarboxylase
MDIKTLTADKIVRELRKCGVTHVVGLPDGESNSVYEAAVTQDGLTVVPICREGEAVAIAAGLLLGGKTPVVLHQNTGFFEAGDSIRGLALDLRLPLLMMIGYRGWRRDKPLTDSAAIFLEPVLDAWDIKHYLVESENDVQAVSQALREANETQKPVAILLGTGGE